MTKCVDWRSYDLLHGNSNGRPVLALRLADAAGDRVYPLTLDEAVELGNSLVTGAAALYRSKRD